jgi:hypothetical protein
MAGVSMPKDKSGRHHPNVQQAMASDKGQQKAPAVHDPMENPPMHEGGEGGEHVMSTFRHGDGTHHSEMADGTRFEHPHAGHLAAHVAHHHMPEAEHKVESHDGAERITHHVGQDGEVQQGEQENQGQHEGDGY